MSIDVPTFRILVAYDGTEFVGWQRQASGISIQGLLEDALKPLEGRSVTVTGAGRTDAGVHAVGQVAAFSLDRTIDPATIVRALNARLPPAVRVTCAEEVPSTFRARFDARSKTYRYRIWNADVVSPFERRYVWHLPGALDRDAMNAAARMLEGTHDFAAFQASGGDADTTTRTVMSSRVSAAGEPGPHPSHAPLVLYEIVGDGFLRHMVRAIVGTLVEIGRRRRPPEWVGEVVASRTRSAAGRSAPAGGLFLVSVDYGDPVAAEP